MGQGTKASGQEVEINKGTDTPTERDSDRKSGQGLSFDQEQQERDKPWRPADDDQQQGNSEQMKVQHVSDDAEYSTGRSCY